METKLNYFAELSKVNVNSKAEKKGRFTYLSWAYAWSEIKKVDENATFVVHENVNQMPFFYDANFTKLGAFVKVSVTVNNITHTQTHPILNNNNAAVAVDSINSFMINTSIQRALAKAIALHGLGLYIYAGEDLPEVETTETVTEDKQVTKHNSSVASGLFADQLQQEETLYIAACEDVKGACYNNKEQLKKLGFKFEMNLKTWIKIGEDVNVKIPGITFEKMTKEVFLNSIKEAKNEN